MILDQSAKDNGRSVRSSNVGADVLGVDCRNIIAADHLASARHNTVDLLQNIERHLLLGIDKRDDLKLEHDLFVLDARRNSSCGSNNIIRICKGVYRHGNLLPRSNDGLFVVAGENGRARKNFESAGGLQQMHNSRERVASRKINVGSVAYVLDDLAEVDQIGWIENIADNRGHAAARADARGYGGTRDGNPRVIGVKDAIVTRGAHEPSVVLCEPIDTEFLIVAKC